MFGFQQFNHDRLLTQSRMHRVYSPTVVRPRTQILQKVHSPNPPEKFESFQYSLTDFINNLQNQVQRLSPNFAFKYSADPPLIQAFTYISQSIDSILEEKAKKSESSEDLRNPPEIAQQPSPKQSHLSKTDLEKAKETNKNLQKYEKILKKKEEKFIKEKNEVSQLKKKLQDWEQQLTKQQLKLQSQEQSWLELQKQEKQKIQSQNEDLQKKILEFSNFEERTKKRLEDATKQLKYEKEALGQLEKCLNESKMKILEDQKELTVEKINLEQQKWNVDQAQRKIDEANFGLKLAQEQLQKDLGLITQEKLELVQAKNEFLKEKNEFNAGKNLRTVPWRTEDKTFEFSGEMESEIKMNEVSHKDIELNYKKIQHQLENTSRELEEKQFMLDEQEESLQKAEKDLKHKFDNIKKIESSLTETKIQFEELKTNTIPDLENQSNLLGNLVREIQLKKNELEVSIFKLTKEIEFVQKYKKKLDAESEARERILAGVPEGQYEEIKVLVEDLEEKLRKVIFREEELQDEEKRMEDERKKMVENAEFLKKAHLDLQNSRAKLEDEKVRIRNMENELEKKMAEARFKGAQ